MKYSQEEIMELLEKLRQDDSWEKDEVKRKKAADSLLITFFK